MNKRRTGSLIRMNVTVPADLREQMKQIGQRINWSQVATEAFREVVKQGPPASETSENRIRRRLRRK